MTSNSLGIIVEQSKALLAQYGSRRLTMDIIARELHVSKRTIYEHYRSKEEFIDAVCHSFVEQDTKETKLAVEAAQTYPDKLRAVCHIYGLEPFGGKLASSAELLELRQRYPEAWVTLQAIGKNKLTTIAKIYKAGAKSGVFMKSIPSLENPRKRLKVDEIAQLISTIMASIVGTSVNSWLSGFSDDVNTLLAYNCELILHGLCVPQEQE